MPANCYDCGHPCCCQPTVKMPITREQRMAEMGFEPPGPRAYTVGDAIGLRRELREQAAQAFAAKAPRPEPLRVRVELEPEPVEWTAPIETRDARLAWFARGARDACIGVVVGLAIGGSLGAALRWVLP